MYNFDVKKVTTDCISFIKNFFEVNGNNSNAVLGVSGGKDSSVCAALLKEALGANKVIGVLMPCGVQPDIEFSYQLVNDLKIKSFTVNLETTKNALIKELTASLEPSKQTLINLMPRLRMSTVYAVSQSVNGRVCNTSNLSERFVGYSTRYGDSVGDFAPLFNLTATEVVQIGDYLGLSNALTYKIPSDGLTGKTDEDNLGFLYKDLDLFLRTGVCDTVVKNKIMARHNLNAFKLKPMPAFIPAGIDNVI